MSPWWLIQVCIAIPAATETLMLRVDPSIYADMEGSTDSEMLFFLALSFGLTDDPVGAVERAVGFVEKVASDHGLPFTISANNARRTQTTRSSWDRPATTLSRKAA